MDLIDTADASWAFDAYERARARLPMARFPEISGRARTLAEIADRYDAFLLDAFGVLNIGESAIPGAVGRMADLRRAGKRLIVLTNSASQPTAETVRKFARLGFDFATDEVVSSRDALTLALAGRAERPWGVMAQGNARLETLGVETLLLEEDPAAYARAEGFILLGSRDWTERRQVLLASALSARPRPVLVGNPDIVAPREQGLTREPGHFAHQLAEAGLAEPLFFGKPFPEVYRLAMARLPDGLDPRRVLMVGDTLHTDVIGGAAAGIDTALITEFGFFAGKDHMAAIARSEIRPTWLVTRP